MNESAVKYFNPSYLECLGAVAFEAKEYTESHKYLHRAYTLRSAEPHCNIEYLELIFKLAVSTIRKEGGRITKEFLVYAADIRSLTGDVKNCMCLVEIAEIIVADAR